MLKTVCQNTLPFHSHRDITARFDGGSLTSDAGWLLFGSLGSATSIVRGLQFVYCGKPGPTLHSS